MDLYISNAHSIAGIDMLFTSDKVDPATLDEALDGLVPKNIQVVCNQVHNLLSTIWK